MNNPLMQRHTKLAANTIALLTIIMMLTIAQFVLQETRTHSATMHTCRETRFITARHLLSGILQRLSLVHDIRRISIMLFLHMRFTKIVGVYSQVKTV